ncbi:pirin family protein [Flaviaesturariibacter flavus]|uniref:Pirin family protein n=1 Tax=Flaviaesturariibacter flavus TaxID=2502780 RepID=A0A4V2NWY6_9BACT|nr:pirin family protein [Flaviaesturariibacter flavus]TCJ19162.1 pirin family protein [Flaviaesturariibacter flavus]
MNSVLHKAATRGHASHGWLDSWHTFSFAGYHDPARVHFGALRVLNDDSVAPSMGFGKHPHDNMEIISIPLEGDLEHGDNMGNTTVIRQGDVQIMSAGTGVVHSEKNANSDRPVKFLQIWVFPKERNVKPRYDQKSFPVESRRNSLQTVVSPVGSGDEGVQIHQDAWFSLGQLDKGNTLEYTLHNPKNGVYAFVLEGDVFLNEVLLNRRDGLGVSDVDKFTLRADSSAEILLMEVPMA